MNKIIGDKGRSRFDPDLAREINEKIAKGELKEKIEEKKVEQKNVLITPNDDSWLIESDKYKIQLSKYLIPLSAQEQKITNYLNNPNSFKPASYPEIFLIGNILSHNNYQHKNEVLNFLRGSFDKYWIQTSSGVLYKSQGLDKLIHNWGLPIETRIDSDFAGPNGNIESVDETILKQLTDLKSLDEIKEIAQFLTKINKIFLFRPSKNKQDIYRVAGFYTNYHDANFDCSWDRIFSFPAFGVRVAKNQEKK